MKNNFTMVDVPLHVAKEFKKDVAIKYGNIYWVKLMDLMRKAEAYDVFIGMTGGQQEIEDESKEEEIIETMGGRIKVKKNDINNNID